uniref:Uncharacterized protein n=1 Tax=Setaria viridis TaxID=4556 RepID=A0A4U6U4J5_SETVI|nr:hypothetical protein SEVIR_6G171450v2 [Setaria viridis]
MGRREGARRPTSSRRRQSPNWLLEEGVCGGATSLRRVAVDEGRRVDELPFPFAAGRWLRLREARPCLVSISARQR